MTVRESLNQVIATLPDNRLQQLLEIAEHLAVKGELRDWQQQAREQLAKAYGDSEPEYTPADIKR